MKRPPTKKQMISHRNRFLKQSMLLVLIIGMIYWMGWKSPWAKRTSQVSVYAIDMPHPAVLKQAKADGSATSTQSSSKTAISQDSHTPANSHQ